MQGLLRNTALGCEIERELDIGLTQLRAGNALIDIVDVNSNLGRQRGPGPAADGSAANLDHFCLRIEPFDAVALARHLQRHDVEATQVTTVYGAEGFGPSIYVTDPERNVVELKGPAQSP